MIVYEFFKYFLAFMIYSFLGWSIEVMLSIVQHKRFVNRGFLIGPYCPIYGFGMLLIVFLLKDYTNSPLALFVLAMVICLVLEYLTSYFMELIFKARWWDYTNKKYNINGRVCLEYAIFFGIGGTLIMYVVHPFIMNIVNKFSGIVLLLVGAILFVGFIIDIVMSIDAMSKINKFEFKKYKDSTEDISEKIREYLLENSFLTKRLARAFPDLRMRLEKYSILIKK